MTRRRLLVGLLLVGALGLAVLSMAPATAAGDVRRIDLDCKESPTPDMPGQGMAGFFGPEPEKLPPVDDPFADGASTTVYEQYGFAGLRWNNYDLGCGPDAANNPEAVLGTSVSNWVMNVPVAVASLTASLTEVAFEPSFLDAFDPLLTQVSAALHDSLFARWLPAVVALIGVMLLIRARGMSLATTAAAIGWALFVAVLAAALFRWPVEAGHFADDTVTASLGAVVEGLNGDAGADPATSVAANVQSSILYPAWVAGTLGSTDSETALTYGPQLFAAQALTWREARAVQSDPEAARAIIEQKQEDFGRIAEEIKASDPTAYEFLTGARADTRVAYAFLATLATLMALPFLLVSALLLLASFFIVRLAVMLFPAFAVLGLFPAARGLVIGVGRTVGAALINAVIFGIGAAVTISVIGVILDPATGLPGWLALVLLPLFSFTMWVVLKPFRRLTSLAGVHGDPFRDGAGALGQSAVAVGRTSKKVVAGAAAASTGGAAAGAAAAAAVADTEVPDRAESRPSPAPPPSSEGSGETATSHEPRLALAGVQQAPALTARPAAPGLPFRHSGESTQASSQASEIDSLPPTEPEWFDGEEVYPIYRPSGDAAARV